MPQDGLTPAEYALAERTTFRSVLATGLLYPSWGWMVRAVDPRVVDPDWLRWVIAGFCLFLASIGWRIVSIRRFVMVMRPVSFVLVAHQLWLIYTNTLDALYFAILFMIVPLTAMGFLWLPLLKGMLALVVVTMAGICLAHPAFPELGRLGYFTGTVFVCWLSCIQVAQRNAAALALRESEAQIRAQADALRVARDEAVRANKAKGEFLATVSHELRNPMNGVLGMAGLLLDTRLDRQQAEYARIIVSSGETLMRLLNDLLDNSKVEAGMMELEQRPFSIRRVVTEVVALHSDACAQKGLELRTSIGPTVPEVVLGDPGRLRQIWMNLLNNAIKFCEKGRIELGISAVVAEGRARLVCEVRDSGVGMSSAELERLFVRYGQVDADPERRQRGTGLGLSISRQLVALMGGELRVESEKGVGSRFWFEVELPVVTATPEPSRSSPAGVEQGGPVLVVDDSRINQRVLSAMLQKLGFEAGQVDVAGDGDDAVRMVAQGRYRIVFMDCEMPRLDGLEATRQIRALGGAQGAVRVIGVSGRALDEERAACLAAGMDGYLTKPVQLEVLRRVLTS